MKSAGNSIKNLDRLQSQLINQTFVVFTSLALITLVFSTFRSYTFGFNAHYFIQCAVTLALAICTIYRYQTNKIFKVYAVIVFIAMILFSGLNTIGFLASAKIYVAFGPVFILLVTNYKIALRSVFIFLGIYVMFGVLYISGIKTHIIDFPSYVSSGATWGVDLLLIFLSVFGLLFLAKNYHQSLFNSFIELEKYKANLEEAVDQKTSALNNTVAELNANNSKLSATLANLQKAQAKLVDSEKMASLGTLTSGIAHEINNPINFIQGGVDGLTQHLRNKNLLDDEAKELLNYLKIGVHRTLKIVQGLNDFSRNNIEHNEKCDINEILNNCILFLKSDYKSKIQFKKQYAEYPIQILGNVGRLHQAFLNIITNAAQSIEANEGVIQIDTEIANNKVIVRIKDNGVGIPKEIIGEITQPFFTTKSPGEGTGLGLSITNTIINDHNGELSFCSDQSTGTEALIILPLS